MLNFTTLKHSVTLKFPCLQIYKGCANVKTTINQCCFYNIKTFRVSKISVSPKISLSQNSRVSKSGMVVQMLKQQLTNVAFLQH